MTKCNPTLPTDIYVESAPLLKLFLEILLSAGLTNYHLPFLPPKVSAGLGCMTNILSLADLGLVLGFGRMSDEQFSVGFRTST